MVDRIRRMNEFPAPSVATPIRPAPRAGIAWRALVVAAAFAGLDGCGQKGPLYLPAPHAATSQAASAASAPNP